MSSTKLIATQRREKNMWKSGDIVVCRGIFRNLVWSALTTIAVKDAPEEIALVLLPGAECMVEADYAPGKKNGNRRWDFKDKAWQLAKYSWRTNRVLLTLEPENYYATTFFWNHENNRFIGYYINFQLPFMRSHCGIDTLDLELDIDVHPDLSFEWKDVDDYKKGLETGIILPEWADEIEVAKKEILGKLAKCIYPFDGAWLGWMPDANWAPPTLPQNWDKI
jgi:hypothetical protein